MWLPRRHVFLRVAADFRDAPVLSSPSSLVHFHLVIQTFSFPVPTAKEKGRPHTADAPDPCPRARGSVDLGDQAAFLASTIFLPSTILVPEAGLLSTAMRRGFIASGNSRSRSTCRTPSASVAPTTLT